MRLRNFLLADAVAVSSDNKAYIHGAGVTSIPAADFPYAHPKLGIFITLVFEEGELGAPHRALVVLRDEKPGGSSPETLLDVNLSPPDRMANLVVMSLAGDVVGLGFPRQSRYGFVLSVDGVELDRIRVEVGTPTPKLDRGSSGEP
jgi:hypothetical protein